MDISKEFYGVAPEDLWVYNKLRIARLMGYTCGPVGVPVPRSGYYMVRPAVNFMGMGRNAYKKYLLPTDDADDYGSPGDFWVEFFSGRHISVDFYENGEQLAILGTRRDTDEYSKWQKWEKIEEFIKFPSILENLRGKYPVINCEFIDGKLIEVQLRENQDFQWGNEEAIPVLHEDVLNCPPGYEFKLSVDYNRFGFYVR